MKAKNYVYICAFIVTCTSQESSNTCTIIAEVTSMPSTKSVIKEGENHDCKVIFGFEGDSSVSYITDVETIVLVV